MMKLNTIEGRKNPRSILRLPVKLELGGTGTSTNIFLGYSFNASKSGMALDLSPDLNIDTNSEVFLYLDSSHPHSFSSDKIPAKVVWSSNSQCGLQFLEEYDEIHRLLNPEIKNTSYKKLRKFYPYVNGQDVDTKQYKYFPYADKAITSF